MSYRLPCSFIKVHDRLRSTHHAVLYAVIGLWSKVILQKSNGPDRVMFFDRQETRVNWAKEKVRKESEKREMSVYRSLSRLDCTLKVKGP